jgi:hypothetical protein
MDGKTGAEELIAKVIGLPRHWLDCIQHRYLVSRFLRRFRHGN